MADLALVTIITARKLCARFRCLQTKLLIFSITHKTKLTKIMYILNCYIYCINNIFWIRMKYSIKTASRDAVFSSRQALL